MKLSDVKERVDIFHEHEDKFKEQIKRCTTVHDKLIVLDLMNEDIIYAGNRFMIYALFPECNISIHKMWGFQRQNVVLATGASIVNRTSKTNIGALMLEFGGGGHEKAGTCQIATNEADAVLRKLILTINQEG